MLVRKQDALQGERSTGRIRDEVIPGMEGSDGVLPRGYSRIVGRTCIMTPRLQRHRTDRKLGGVCGGLGLYLGVDPTWVRLAFVIFALATGFGVLVYMLLWLIVPEQGKGGASAAETVQEGVHDIAERTRHAMWEFKSAAAGPHPRAGRMLGAILIGLGLIFLSQTMGLPWLRWLNLDVLWPLVLIGVGFMLLWNRGRGGGR